MRIPFLHPAAVAALLVSALLAMAAPAIATAAPGQPTAPAAIATADSLVQLPGSKGCTVDRAVAKPGCRSARALDGPAPFLGSRAMALSPDGRNLYVASSGSDAIAIFRRDPRSGALTQPQGPAGCVAAEGAAGCAPAVGIDGPNSLAVSADGRSVYVTSREQRGAHQLPPRSQDRSAGAGGGRQRLHRRHPDGRLRLRAGAGRSGRGHGQPRRRQRLRRLLLRQRGRDLQPLGLQRRPQPARAAAAAASPWRSVAARSASPSALRRGWRSAATAPASTSPRRSPTRSPCSRATRPPAL